MDWDKKCDLIGADKLTDLIESVLDIEISNSKKAVINHLIKTECLKYENVLSEVGEEMSYYQSDYGSINRMMVTLNSGLYYLPKKNVE